MENDMGYEVKSSCSEFSEYPKIAGMVEDEADDACVVIEEDGDTLISGKCSDNHAKMCQDRLSYKGDRRMQKVQQREGAGGTHQDGKGMEDKDHHYEEEVQDLKGCKICYLGGKKSPKEGSNRVRDKKEGSNRVRDKKRGETGGF